MTKVAVTRISSKLDAQLATTVEFLRDAREKGFEKNVDLRTYLKSRRGLTPQQIDRAFSILNKNSSGSEDVKVSSVYKDLQALEQNEGAKVSDAHRKNSLPELRSISNLNSRIISSDDYKSKSLSFLLAEKRALGEKELQMFMRNEVSYCAILECLHCVYYDALVNMADKNKFKMTRKEVEEIFEYIPDMFKFHRDTLPTQLGKGKENIGKTFLRYIKAFVFYIDYMKECSSTVNKMTEYTSDKNLHRCLKSIKKSSNFQAKDMIDLLLAPLERICEYKVFLDNLLNWADNSRQSDYELISKAARRIGRVVEYIEKYKYGIINHSEINKVQEFVRNDYQIAAPKRQIIRRGLMTRHFTGWATRNKRYIFFLFNDVFFWTSKKGEMQDIVSLRNCELMDSDSKNNPMRKFKIVHKGAKKKKIFDLECTNMRQRKQWFDAISKTISTMKMVHDQGVTSQLCNESISSDPPIPPILINRRSHSNSRCSSRQQSCEFRLGNSDEKGEETPGYGRYEWSQNFKECDFKEFGPREDTVSVQDFELREDTISISELDYIYSDKKGEGLLDFLNKSESSSGPKIQMREVNERCSTERLTKITEECVQENDSEDDSNEEVSASVPQLKQDNKSSSIIRRGHPKTDSSGIVPSSTLQTQSKLIIRLNDFVH